MPKSLFERMGGEAAVMAAVDIFYKKVIADPLVEPFFSKLDMDAQVAKQVGFMTWAFGGPAEYRGRDLRTAHQALKLDDRHFAAVAGHLHATLRELSIPDDLIGEVLTIVGSTKNDVLNR